MKTIELSFSYDEGNARNGTRNGVMNESKTTINIEHIVSIKPWVGKNIHDGRFGTEVTDVNGTKHLDDRPYEKFCEAIHMKYYIKQS